MANGDRKMRKEGTKKSVMGEERKEGKMEI